MGEDELGQMTVHISGRSYPLKVKASEEAVINEVVSQLNNTVTQYQSTYANKDKQDCLSMALLTYAVNLKKAKSDILDQHIAERIDQLDQLLDDMLAD